MPDRKATHNGYQTNHRSTVLPFIETGYPQWNNILPSCLFCVAADDTDNFIDAPKRPGAGSQYRWRYVNIIHAPISLSKDQDFASLDPSLHSKPTTTSLARLTNFYFAFIQASAQHSATFGGTASISPASGNEINSTPSSRIKELGMLVSSRAVKGICGC